MKLEASVGRGCGNRRTVRRRGSTVVLRGIPAHKKGQG